MKSDPTVDKVFQELIDGVAQTNDLSVQAKQGDPQAQCDLGDRYRTGEFLETNPDKAFFWYRQAAMQGYAKGQNKLGECYASGIGTTIDFSKSLFWFQKAAEQNEPKAIYNLALAYREGQGVEPDQLHANRLYLQAAVLGVAEAQYQVSLLYDGKRQTSETIPPVSQEEAFEFLRKAAEQGLAQAQFRLGGCYRRGIGVAKDDCLAFQWIRKAADQRYAPGLFQLGELYVRGIGVSQDFKAAAMCYRQAYLFRSIENRKQLSRQAQAESNK